MKYCGECGQEIKEDARFCPFCGSQQPIQTQPNKQNLSEPATHESKTDILETAVEETPQENTIQHKDIQESQPEGQAPRLTDESYKESARTQSSQSVHSGFSPEQLKNNETVQQLSKNGKNYLNYLNKNVRKPKIGQNEAGAFGLVNFLLITLFSGLAISHAWAPLLQYGGSTTSAFPYVIPFILWIGLSLVTCVLVIFVAGTQLYKREMTFLEAFEWVFAPNSLSVYISLVVFILSFLVNGGAQIFYLFFTAPFVLTNISYMGSLWELPMQNNQKNKFYITVLSVVVGAVIIFVISRIFGGMIIEDFAKNNFLFNRMGNLF